MRYPDVPFSGHTWPITQHAGVISPRVLNGLLEACMLCNGQVANADVINSFLVQKGLLTANYRADSNRIDAWRDYQQILSEFGLIFSTRVSREIRLTPIALSFIDGNVSYEEMITLQILKYQYPNGHKSQISPSMRDSFEGEFEYNSFTEMQASNGILIRPAVAIWQILFYLFQRGENPQLTIDELQQYVVRCLRSEDVSICVETIISSRHGGQVLAPLARARRNMADWIKILNNTPLFEVGNNASTIHLSTYSLEQSESLYNMCMYLSHPDTFWIYSYKESYKFDWFSFYGNIDLNVSLIPMSSEQEALQSSSVSESNDNMTKYLSPREVNLQPFVPIINRTINQNERKIVSEYDFQKSHRGRNLHDGMVNLIAERCIAKGAEVYSDSKSVDLYVNYQNFELLIEVKSITPSNFIARLRYAIGQIHQYNYLMPVKSGCTRRLGLAFTAQVPNNSWYIPFVKDYFNMDLFMLQSSMLKVDTNDQMVNYLFS